MNAFPLALTATGFTFLCTAFGAAFVFVVGHSRKKTVVQVSLGFAAGIMLAASVFGLLIPSIDGARAAGGGLTAPAGGFVLGVLLLMLMNRLVPHLHTNADEPEGVRSGLGRQSLLFLAITIHNVPEGMALGVLAAAAGGSVPEGMGALMALAIGIGIQNIPEGTAVSVPLFAAGGTRKKILSPGSAFRRGRTGRCPSRGLLPGSRCFPSAMVPVILRGGHALRGGGGTHS